MGKTQKAKTGFCDIPIVEIKVGANCRDDVPGLQPVHGDETLRQ